MHGHPNQASSWKMPEMVKLATRRRVEMTTCDTCAYGMGAKHRQGIVPAEKRTRLASNSTEVIKRAWEQCTNKGSKYDGNRHRHADLTAGMAKQCQVYPNEFCRAVYAGVAAKKKLVNLGVDGYKAPRFIQRSGCLAEGLHPSRGVVAGCGLATTFVRIACIDVFEKLQASHPYVRFEAYIDEITITCEGTERGSGETHNRSCARLHQGRPV